LQQLSTLHEETATAKGNDKTKSMIRLILMAIDWMDGSSSVSFFLVPPDENGAHVIHSVLVATILGDKLF
jgi:hypothetical protein